MEFHTFPQSMQIIYHHNSLRALCINPGNQINFDKSVGQLIHMWLFKRLRYLIYIKHLCISNLSTLSLCVCSVIQSCLILCHSLDCSPPVSLSMRILQRRILEQVAMPSFRRSSRKVTEPRCPVLQVDSLVSESPGNQIYQKNINSHFTGFSVYSVSTCVLDLWLSSAEFHSNHPQYIFRSGPTNFPHQP